MRSLLVPLMGLGNDKATLEMAGRVAALFGSHIDALHVGRSTAAEIADLTLGEGIISQDVYDAVEAEAVERRTVAEEAFKAFCREKSIPVVPARRVQPETCASWRHIVGNLMDEVVSTGRRHDIVVAAREAAPFGHPVGVLGEIITRCGRPLLVVPQLLPSTSGRTVAIAWKNTLEGAHALTAAMPLVARAERIVVLAAPEEDSDAAEREAGLLAEQLRWLPGEVDVQFCVPGLGSTAEALVDGAKTARADLIVMGGYGHSRARELVLGGVTRDLLRGCALPLLITH